MKISFIQTMVMAGVMMTMHASLVMAQGEPVEHNSQFIPAIKLMLGAQEALEFQEDLVSGTNRLNNMLGGMGRYVSPYLKAGDAVMGQRSNLLRAKKLSLGGLMDEDGLKNYNRASEMLDQNFLFDGAQSNSYSVSDIERVMENQRRSLNDLAVDGIAYSSGTKAISSEHGSIDLDTIAKSVEGANSLQEIFRVLTASDRQILSNALTLASTEATLGTLMATEVLKDVAVNPSSAPDIKKAQEKSGGKSDLLDKAMNPGLKKSAGIVEQVKEKAGAVQKNSQSIAEQVQSDLKKVTSTGKES